MSKTLEEESPPLSDEEIADIEYFYAHPEEHRILAPQELLDELHRAVKECGA